MCLQKSPLSRTQAVGTDTHTGEVLYIYVRKYSKMIDKLGEGHGITVARDTKMKQYTMCCLFRVLLSLPLSLLPNCPGFPWNEPPPAVWWSVELNCPGTTAMPMGERYTHIVPSFLCPESR